jgi:hypothetical protein
MNERPDVVIYKRFQVGGGFFLFGVGPCVGSREYCALVLDGNVDDDC